MSESLLSGQVEREPDPIPQYQETEESPQEPNDPTDGYAPTDEELQDALNSIEFACIFEYLFLPYRYKVAYGGRASGKSWSYARALIILASRYKLRILCAREFQNSISESVHQLLKEQIEELGLGYWFTVNDKSITSRTGSEFIFVGIRSNIGKIKSMEGIDICWVEEAQKVSADSWKVLFPTIRRNSKELALAYGVPKTKCEIWVTFNPDEELDPTYQNFVANKRPGSYVLRVNWDQNPWMPDAAIEEKEYLAKLDPESYENVWNGVPRQNSSSQIMRNKYRIDFVRPPSPDGDVPLWDGPYYGADWGFSQDPTCLLKLWIDVPNRRLLVEREVWGIGIELDDIGDAFKKIAPDLARWEIQADNSRPETINHVANKAGLNIVPVEKWPGSVEDGIAFLKGNFEEIVVDPSCRHTLDEMRLYSYKVDRLTGRVLTDIVDRDNHCIDAIRYGLGRLIFSQTNIGIWSKM